jgi:hypothetical protein
MGFHICEEASMQLTEKHKTLLLGAAGGALLFGMVGFSWDFMLTPGEAQDMARKQSSAAVATALAPFCVERFQRQPDAVAKLGELEKMDQWARASFIEKGGWAKSTVESQQQSEVAAACADALVKKGAKGA